MGLGGDGATTTGSDKNVLTRHYCFVLNNKTTIGIRCGRNFIGNNQLSGRKLSSFAPRGNQQPRKKTSSVLHQKHSLSKEFADDCESPESWKESFESQKRMKKFLLIVGSFIPRGVKCLFEFPDDILLYQKFVQYSNAKSGSIYYTECKCSGEISH